MVLQIFRKDLWDPIEIHSYRELYSHESIREANESFHHSPLHVVQSHEFSFYCHQQEIGMDLPQDDYEIIGSDDATTCHILLASYLPSSSSPTHTTTQQQHPPPRQWLISHIASEEEVQELSQYFHQLEAEGGVYQQTYDIYLMGGYGVPGDGGDTLSARLSQEFVNVFQSSALVFRLHLFFTCEVNTTPLSPVPGPSPSRASLSPIFFGCGYQQSTNSVIPLSFPRHLRGPDYLHRSMALWLHSSATTTPQNHATLFPICRGTTIQIDFSFLAQDLSPNIHSFFSFISQLPKTSAADQQILRFTSTSPSCEPSHFVTSIRDLAQHITDLFSPDGRSRYQGPLSATYRRHVNHETQRVEWLRDPQGDDLKTHAIAGTPNRKAIS